MHLYSGPTIERDVYIYVETYLIVFVGAGVDDYLLMHLLTLTLHQVVISSDQHASYIIACVIANILW